MPNTVNRRSGDDDFSSTYPTWIGFIFVFNLIVGTGALTLPAVFVRAGWLFSLIIIVLLAIISYITVTFIIEAMACANAVKNWQHLQFPNNADVGHDENDSDDTESLLPRPLSAEQLVGGVSNGHDESGPLHVTQFTNYYYRLDTKFELGGMSVLFFNDVGRILFYLCFATYLYGDLSIYTAAVAKSLRDIACTNKNSTIPTNVTLFNFADADSNDIITPCWLQHTLTRLQVYRLFVIGFTVVLGPFVAFTVQKTKYLQIMAVVFRWLAFTFMIAIALKLLFTDGAKGHPVAFNASGVPALFGACVYSFMCHHSLPSLLSPIRNKAKLLTLLSYDYLLICAFYIILAMTGIFAFAHLEDLYTLNFIPRQTGNHSFEAQLLLVIDYFLGLFPVCTLSASYPIIAITLRNNLQTLFLDMARFESYNFYVRRVVFPLMTIVPPFVVTYFTESITSLVAFTGSYAGAGIQYLIPVCLIYYARQTCTELLGNGIVNDFQSPFRSKYWLLFILFWALTCMCFVTINFFVNAN